VTGNRKNRHIYRSCMQVGCRWCQSTGSGVQEGSCSQCYWH